MGHLSSYHVYSHSYGLKKVRNCQFFVFFADNSKTFVTVWAICSRRNMFKTHGRYY